MPSMEVPLINPIARIVPRMAPFPLRPVHSREDLLHHRSFPSSEQIDMTTLRSDFLRTLQERGYIHQCSDLERLDAKASEGPITAYIGFDATASSLHAGHLLSIMMLRTLQRTGHRPIALMGGGTTKIGDPSGKDEARKMLTMRRSTRTSPPSARCSPASSIFEAARSWRTMRTGWTS